MTDILMFDGISLHTYCKENNICYPSKVRMIKNIIAQNTGESIDDIIKRVMTTSRNIYFYDNMTLKKYCETHNLNYDSILTRVIRLKKKSPNLSNDELVALALDQKPWIKYYYGTETLSSYCNKHDLNINYVTERILRTMDNNPNLSLEEAISLNVQYYKYKKYLQNVTRIFIYLKKNDSFENDILIKITRYLCIDFDNFQHLVSKYKYKVHEAMALIWYFHDSKPDDTLSISITRLRQVLKDIRTLSNGIVNPAELDFGVLFGIYKTGLFDTRHLILLRQENFIYYTVYKTLNNFSLNLNRGLIDDICDEVKVFLLEILERLDNNIIAKVICYITKAIRGFVVDYVIDIKKNEETLSIEAESLKSKPLKDRISSSTDDSNSNFEEDTLTFFDSFDSKIKDFIVYKFQNNLSDEEIASIFNISVEELKRYEHDLFFKLRNDQAFLQFFNAASR